MAETTQSAAAFAAQHPTTAAVGIGGSVSIIVMSLLLHANIHLTEEEAIAWTAAISGVIGWGLKLIERKWPTVGAEIEADGAVLAPLVTPERVEALEQAVAALRNGTKLTVTGVPMHLDRIITAGSTENASAAPTAAAVVASPLPTLDPIAAAAASLQPHS